MVGRPPNVGSTRRSILEVAVGTFDELGFGACTMADVVARSALTKGAVYYYFGSKQDIATALVEEADARIGEAFRQTTRDSAPMLELIVEGCLNAAMLIDDDPLVRMGLRLSRVPGGHADWTRTVLSGWVTSLAAGLAIAADQGDVRADLDGRVAAELVCTVMIGAAALAPAEDRTTVQIVLSAWELLVPVIVDENGRDYWEKFVAVRVRKCAPG